MKVKAQMYVVGDTKIYVVADKVAYVTRHPRDAKRYYKVDERGECECKAFTFRRTCCHVKALDTAMRSRLATA